MKSAKLHYVFHVDDKQFTLDKDVHALAYFHKDLKM